MVAVVVLTFFEWWKLSWVQLSWWELSLLAWLMSCNEINLICILKPVIVIFLLWYFMHKIVELIKLEYYFACLILQYKYNQWRPQDFLSGGNGQAIWRQSRPPPQGVRGRRPPDGSEVSFFKTIQSIWKLIQF